MAASDEAGFRLRRQFAETSRKRGFEILPRLTCGNRAEKLRVVLFHPKRWFSTEPSHITHGLRRKAFALQA
ncbi:MAG: hypothetical protein DMF94_06110 [Acidobacteria bacterium]|nr:MAG: hypothetical protein DMF94_06110 [Acidobacteriota bacterium]